MLTVDYDYGDGDANDDEEDNSDDDDDDDDSKLLKGRTHPFFPTLEIARPQPSLVHWCTKHWKVE